MYYLYNIKIKQLLKTRNYENLRRNVQSVTRHPFFYWRIIGRRYCLLLQRINNQPTMNHGGKRKGAGRKPPQSPQKQLQMRVPAHRLDEFKSLIKSKINENNQ